MNDESQTLSTFQWWAKRRLHYNISLACAGFVAFVCYAVVIFTSEEVIPDADINFVTIVGQGLGYLILMAVANICFFAGPISEKMIKPQNPDSFRIITYRMGYWFSVLLPLCIPVLLLYLVLFYPEYWAQMN